MDEVIEAIARYETQILESCEGYAHGQRLLGLSPLQAVAEVANLPGDPGDVLTCLKSLLAYYLATEATA